MTDDDMRDIERGAPSHGAAVMIFVTMIAIVAALVWANKNLDTYERVEVEKFVHVAEVNACAFSPRHNGIACAVTLENGNVFTIAGPTAVGATLRLYSVVERRTSPDGKVLGDTTIHDWRVDDYYRGAR